MKKWRIRGWLILLTGAVLVIHPFGPLSADKGGGVVHIIYSNDVAGYLEPCG